MACCRRVAKAALFLLVVLAAYCSAEEGSSMGLPLRGGQPEPAWKNGNVFRGLDKLGVVTRNPLGSRELQEFDFWEAWQNSAPSSDCDNVASTARNEISKAFNLLKPKQVIKFLETKPAEEVAEFLLGVGGLSKEIISELVLRKKPVVRMGGALGGAAATAAATGTVLEEKKEEEEVTGKEFPGFQVFEKIAEALDLRDRNVLDALRSVFSVITPVGDSQAGERLCIMFGQTYIDQNRCSLEDPFDSCRWVQNALAADQFCLTAIMVNTARIQWQLKKPGSIDLRFNAEEAARFSKENELGFPGARTVEYDAFWNALGADLYDIGLPVGESMPKSPVVKSEIVEDKNGNRFLATVYVNGCLRLQRQDLCNMCLARPKVDGKKSKWCELGPEYKGEAVSHCAVSPTSCFEGLSKVDRKNAKKNAKKIKKDKDCPKFGVDESVKFYLAKNAPADEQVTLQLRDVKIIEKEECFRASEDPRHSFCSLSPFQTADWGRVLRHAETRIPIRHVPVTASEASTEAISGDSSRGDSEDSSEMENDRPSPLPDLHMSSSEPSNSDLDVRHTGQGADIWV